MTSLSSLRKQAEDALKEASKVKDSWKIVNSILSSLEVIKIVEGTFISLPKTISPDGNFSLDPSPELLAQNMNLVPIGVRTAEIAIFTEIPIDEIPFAEYKWIPTGKTYNISSEFASYSNIVPFEVLKNMIKQLKPILANININSLPRKRTTCGYEVDYRIVWDFNIYHV